MLEPTYKIAAALCNGAAAVDQAAALHPDLIILDISLGDVSGFEVARRLKRAVAQLRSSSCHSMKTWISWVPPSVWVLPDLYSSLA